MTTTVEQIKSRLNIVDVVGSYIKLEKAGVNFKSRCPFHNEKTPSFFISPARDSYYCFGCNKNGDIFSFVQEFEGVDFLGSLKILADKAGVSIEKIDPKLHDENQKILSILEESTSFFERELQKNKEALKYLEKRGFEEKTIKSFRIGFAPNDWRVLLEYLKGRGFKEKEIEDSGMIKESNGKTYDRFRSRIMFPINDQSGRVIAFSGRIFSLSGIDEEGVAKYLNSPETKLFKKSLTLFAYDKAKLDIRRNDFAIIVEGNVDAVIAHQAGYRNTVAPLGTSLTEEQLSRVSKLTKRLVIAFDSDNAGFKASGRGAKMALSMGIDLKVANIPKGLDPAELIKNNTLEWKRVIRESKHIIEFYLEKILFSEKDERKLGLRIKEEILPFVVMLENKIDQAYFVKILAEAMNVSENIIYEEIQKIDLGDLGVPYPDNKEDIKKKNLNGKRESIIRKIMSIIFWQESLKDRVISLSKIKEEFEGIISDETKIQNFSLKDKEDLIFEADVFYTNSENIEVELRELFLRLEEDILKEKLVEEMKKLKKAELNNVDSSDILKECQILSSKIQKIKEKF